MQHFFEKKCRKQRECPVMLRLSRLTAGHRRLLFEGMGGIEDWADFARGRCLAALREVVVSAIPRGSGPGLGA
jgi:hypothetical protein